MSRKIRIFISYSHNDRDLMVRLEVHLAQLESERLIEHWTDLKIDPGDEWNTSIAAELDKCDIILLLVSADFLASSYIQNQELKRALERHKAGEAVVIPVILKPADWKTALFASLQALPTGARPISTSRNREEAFLDVARGIRRVVERLNQPAKPSEDLTANPPTDNEPARQDRILDAAIAKKIFLGKPADLAVMVRCTGSQGLKAILETDDEFTSQPDDVRSKPFQIDFPRDHGGAPKAATLTLKVESPDFDPPSQTKKLAVPPSADSDVCTFLLTPLFPGELVINLEVHTEEGQRAARIFRIVSEASDRVVAKGRVLVSIPISTLAAPRVVEAPRIITTPAPSRSKFPARPLAAVAAFAFTASAGLFYMGQRKSSDFNSAQFEVAKAVSPPALPALSTNVGSRSPASIQGSPPWQASYRKGVEAANAHDLDRAATEFRSSAQLAPEEVAPLVALANTNLKQADASAAGEKQKYVNAAISEASKAAELAPQAWRSFYLQGLAFQRSGRFAEAEASLRKCTRLEPSNAQAWYALGLVLHDLKKPDEAVEPLKTAVKLDPNDDNARLLLAATLARTNPAEARKQIAIVKQKGTLVGTRHDVLERIDALIK